MERWAATSICPSARSVLSTRSFRVWLVAIALAGFCLRLWRLDGQILVGDELYLLWAMHLFSLAELPGAMLPFDFPIPLALLFSFKRDLKSLLMVSQRLVGGDGNLALYATMGLNR